MTYRERRQRRAERLREWAEGREAKSEAAFGRADEVASGIPFGQPILVGHHSEGRARRDQARIEQGLRKGFEHAAKAEDFRRRAAGIEAQAERAIYSDDEDAPERLEARIAELEAKRDRIKAYNASCRKDKRDVELLDAGEQKEIVSLARIGALRGQGAFPAYVLTNLSANIRHNRERLEGLRPTADEDERAERQLALTGVQEPRIVVLRRIVEERTAEEIDGQLVDTFTASALVKLRDALSPENQARFDAVPLARLAGFALKRA